MKTPTLLLAILAAASFATARAEVSDQHLPPAPLPEFKTPAQLAKWKVDVAATTAATEAKASSSTPGAFYTGKPYIAESGTYSYKYREYNPETARWTTVDPSGFPDGANASSYCKNMPINCFDWQGMQTVISTDTWLQDFTFTVNTTQAVVGGLAILGSAYAGPAVAITIAAGGGTIMDLTSYTDPVQTLSSSAYIYEHFDKKVTLYATRTFTTNALTWSTSVDDYHLYITTFTETSLQQTYYFYE